MSKWKMNRAGFVNFWYYDNEIFNFEDGKLLLRGSNGSGKSVTMQSWIPLLLDGDKRPERLDPFGSKARKIDNYLLDENKDEDERTGYIFMEYKKDYSDTFITIGLGIRARKNNPTSSWGFCIMDGRRIGIDFNLTKITTGEIPLSKKELENRLGTGGFMSDKMQEYMHKVNDLLFGYSDIEDYSELIKLLIQLRSPKLSKDFKPTVLYEIMTNSLQTLTDDDLRPMSEAIESMDLTKSRLESLKEAKKSLLRINNTYEKYNHILLYEKAKNLIEVNKEYLQISKDEEQRIKEISEKESKIISTNKSLETAKEEEIFYKTKKESLQDRDEFKQLEKLEDLKKELLDNKVRLDKKNIQMDGKKSKEIDIEHKIKTLDDDCKLKVKNILSMLKDMESLAEDLGFDEHLFMSEEFYKNLSGEYDFTFLQRNVVEYKLLIENALNLLGEKERVIRGYEEKEKQLDLKIRNKDSCQNEVKSAEDIFIEIKEELIEKINKYNEENEHFKIEKKNLERMYDYIYNYSTEDYFDSIRKIYMEDFNSQFNRIDLQIKIKEKDIDNKQQEVIKKKEEIKEWEEKADPEPERKQEVTDSRKKLLELGIPFVPFYKAIDFNEELDEKTRSSIEESLLEMGILDAVIIPDKYKNQVLQLDKGLCDKYIFANPNYLIFELSKIMKIDKNYNDMSSLIDDVLKSILIDETENSTFISENGTFGIGILRGKISGNYKAKYIGYNSRKLFKQMRINELNLELEELIRQKDILTDELYSLKNIKERIAFELENFPSEDELNDSKRILFEAKQRLKISMDEVNRADIELEKLKRDLIQIKEKCYHACEKIYIEPKNYKTFEEALVSIGEYNDNLKDMINEHSLYLSYKINLDEKREDLESLILDISELIAEINDIEKRIKEINSSIDSINESLKLSEINSIRDEINECLKKLDELPEHIINYSKEISSLNTSIEHVKLDLQRIGTLKGETNEKLQRSILWFKNEYGLGFVSDIYINNDDNDCAYNDEGLFDLAKKINLSLEDMKNIKKNSNEIENDLQQIYYIERNMLSEYKLSIETSMDRIMINSRYMGKILDFYELKKQIEENIDTQSQIIKDKDREVFEDILANNLSKKIRSKIFHSKKWVDEMNKLMESLDTSSGLNFSLKWIGKKAESEEELSSEELVNFLERDSKLMRQEDIEKFIRHFKYRIERARNLIIDKGETKSFHATIKDVLDYRNWFEFKLFYTKTNERKKELTNNAFFTFSGGEKAMAMYVPLFSAVYARYQGARKDCPRIICLDEAFAGVDSKNIRDMFRLLEQLDLGFIINSQVLWGDYDTVNSLSIIEIIRPNNSDTVSLMRYKWNGKYKELVV